MRLWCEPGQHFWERPAQPGRPPKACPTHHGSRTAVGARAASSVRPRRSAAAQTRLSTGRRGRWLGDLRRCFLLEEGWGFRLEINRFILAGRAWPIPATVADSLGMESVDHRWLSPRRPDLVARVEVTRSGGSCLVGAIAEPLRRLGARDGDLGFFCFHEAKYAIVLRREDELKAGADPMGQLLWRCGLDPNDSTNRRDPWARLSRALGGSERTRDEVRRRLEARRDSALLTLLDDVGIVAPVRTQGWRTGWQYVIPDVGLDDALVVRAANGQMRRLIGVVDVSGQPAAELLVTDGGLAWIEEESDVPAREVPLLRGLIPAARKLGWTRWLRAEHALRLLGLAGEEFWANRDRTGWRVGGASVGSLIEALDRAPRLVMPVSQGPAEPVRTPYPRATLPFDRAARDAEKRGILALGADTRSGIRAIYGDGREAIGSSLLDVLLGL